MIKKSAKLSSKSLSTPFKVIKILKLLVEKPSSIDEILERLEEDGIFTNKETVSKYFTTLRYAGCDIQKIRNKFYIKYPVVHLDDTELETLAHFDIICKNLNSKENYGEFLKFLSKLFSLTNKNNEYKKMRSTITFDEDFNTGKIGKRYGEKIETISKFIQDTPQKIKIICAEKEFTITPLKFHYFKDSICLLGYDIKNNVNKNFPLDKISDIKGMPTAASSSDFGLITTFKISGRLKNAYTVREGEIISEYEDYIMVSNKKEDKDELFKRLLRYGTFCEILYPKSDREKFKNLLENLIAKFSA